MLRKALVGTVLALGLTSAGPLVAETLPLPDSLIALDSNQGESLLLDAEARRAFLPLSQQFVTQKNGAFCGVASMVMVLNAMNVPAPKALERHPYTAFNQENFFKAETEAVVPRAVIEKMGMTLTQLGGLPGSFGLKADVHHASDSTVDEFRRLARQTIDSDDRHVLVNYLRSAIGQEKYGHISPLAAYDEDTDRFLILDVSRYKYPPVWVETETLFAAMDTPDSDNDHKSRGFVIVSR